MSTESNDPTIQQASATIANALGLSPEAVRIGVGAKPKDDGLVGSDASEPIIVLVESYAAISSEQGDLIKAFYLLKNDLGAQIYDVRRLSEDLMLKRFLHEAKLDKSLTSLMEFLKHQEAQYADYWNELYEITSDMEIIG